MALKKDKKGNYIIKNEKDASEALMLRQAMEDTIARLLAKAKIPDLQADADALKKAATSWAVEHEVERIDFQAGKRAFHATLVEQNYGATYIATDEDIPEDVPDDREIVSFQTVIEEKFKSSVKTKGSKARKIWMKVTKRVLDKEKVEQLVSDGQISVDDLARCFYEKTKTPYLRIFED